MKDDRILKDILYWEFANGKRDTGSLQLPYRHISKRGMKALEINSDHWEDVAADRSERKKHPD